MTIVVKLAAMLEKPKVRPLAVPAWGKCKQRSISLPEKLREVCEKEAMSRNMTFNAFVRDCLIREVSPKTRRRKK
jgi:hypothetical protein